MSNQVWQWREDWRHGVTPPLPPDRNPDALRAWYLARQLWREEVDAKRFPSPIRTK